jgi:hypothetical protein
MAVRFTTHDLMWSITLLSAGMGCLGFALRGVPTGGSLMLWLAGGVFIGAGAVAPFHEKSKGAWLGGCLAAMLIGLFSVFAGK